MKTKSSSWAGKLLAFSLSAAMLVSGLPIGSLAATVPQSPSGDGESTPVYESDAFYQADSDSPTYVSGLTKLFVNELGYDVNLDNIKVYFGKELDVSEGASLPADKVLESETAFSLEEGTFTVDLTMIDEYYDAESKKLNLEDGQYGFVVVNTNESDENKKYLDKRSFVLDNSNPTFVEPSISNDWAKNIEINIEGIEDAGVGLDESNIKVIYKENKTDDESTSTDVTNTFGSGKLTFTADKNGYYMVSVPDLLGNTMIWEKEINKIDTEAPVITFNSDDSYKDKDFIKELKNNSDTAASDKWSAENVNVEFTVTDTQTGVKEVKVKAPDKTDDEILTGSDDKYSFTAEAGGIYTVTAVDNADKKSVKKIKVNIDKKVITEDNISIVFEGAKEGKNKNDKTKTRVYNNNDIKATVYVKRASDLSAVTDIQMKSDSRESVITTTDTKVSSVSKDGITDYSKSFTIPVDNDSAYTDIKIIVTNKAEKTVEFSLHDSKDIKCSIKSDSEKEIEKTPIYEIIASKLAPTIDSVEITGGTSTDVDGRKYYTDGKLTVSAKFTENVFDIDKEDGVHITGADSTDSAKEEALPVETKDSADKYEAQKEIDLAKFGDGSHKVTIAVTNTNDNSTDTDIEFYVDKTAPIVGNIEYSSTNWTNQGVTVSLKPTDGDGSGIAKVEYSNDQSNYLTAGFDSETKKYSFTATSNSVYYIRVIDNVGHKTDKKTETINYDNEAPDVSDISYYDRETKIKDGDWTNNPVTVKFKVTDKKSGVKSVDVTHNDSKVETETTDQPDEYTFVAETFGVYTITPSDNLGNSKDVKTAILNIDNGENRTINASIYKTVSDSDSLLQFLTFGIFSKEALNVQIDVPKIDGRAPVKSIEFVYELNGSEESQKTDDTTASDKFGIFEFEKKDKQNNVYKKLHAVVTDAAGNTYTRYFANGDAVNASTFDQIKVAYYSAKELEQNFGVYISDVTTLQVESVDIAAREGSNEYTVINSSTYYSNDIDIHTKVTDSVIGIKLMNKTPLIDAYVVSNEKFNNIKDAKDTLTKTDFSSMKEAAIGLDLPKNLVSMLNEQDINVTLNTKDYEDGEYTFIIFARDTLDREKYETANFIIDNTASTISNITYNGTDYDHSKWSNTDIDVAFNVTEESSGINTVMYSCSDKGGDSVSGICSYNSETGKYSFKANTNNEYNIKVVDNVSNSTDVNTSFVKYDDKAPTADDFTITFSGDGLVYDEKGVYNDTDIDVKVDVKTAEKTAPIEKIFLKNGDSEIAASADKVTNNEDGTYTLYFKLTPKNEAYVISVSAEDEAGNKSDYFAIGTNYDGEHVHVKAGENAEDLPADLYNVICSNAEPEVTVNNPNPDTKGKTFDNQFYTGSTFEFFVNVKDNLSGVADSDTIKVYLGKSDEFVNDNGTFVINEDKLIDASFDSFDRRGSNPTYSEASFKVIKDMKNLEDGEYTLVVSIENNAGVTGYGKKTFTIDNTAPTISDIKYKYNGKFYDSADAAWTNTDVEVIFKATDVCGFENDSFTVTKPNGEKITAQADTNNGDGSFKFVADEYGVYTITYKDKLDNSGTTETGTVQIDRGDSKNKEFTLVINAENVLVDDKGVYNNTEYVEAQVIVTYAANTAPITEIGMGDLNDSGLIEPIGKLTKGSGRTYSQKFKIYNATEPYQLVLSATDKATNKYEIDDLKKANKVKVNGNGINKDTMGELYELVVTYATPEILIEYNGSSDNQFKVVDSDNETTVYLANTLSFRANIKDELSGISDEDSDSDGLNDNFNVYLGKLEEMKEFVDDKDNEKTADNDILKKSDKVKFTNSLKDSINSSFDEKTQSFTLNLDKFNIIEEANEDGDYVLVITAKNKSGNIAKTAYYFTLDQTAPDKKSLENSITYNGKKYDECDWSSADNEIKFTLSDNISGVRKVTVDIKDGENDTTVLTPDENGVYTFTAFRDDAHKDGVYTISYEDNLGNNDTFKTESVKHDTTAPEVVVTEFGDSYTWGNKDKTVIVTAEDDLSGIIEDSFVVERKTGVDTDGKDVFEEIDLPFEKINTSGESPAVPSIDTDKANGTYPFKQQYKVTIHEYGIYRFSVKNSADMQNYSEKTENILIDKDSPVITSFKFEPKSRDDAIIPWIEFLTFGLYGNSDVKLTVTVKDKVPEGTTEEDISKILKNAGVKDIPSLVRIKLFNGAPQNEISNSGFTTVIDGDTALVSYVYDLPGDNIYDNIYAYIEDKAGNNQNRISLANYVHMRDTNEYIYIDNDDDSDGEKDMDSVFTVPTEFGSYEIRSFKESQTIVSDDIFTITDNSTPDNINVPAHKIDSDTAWYYGDVTAHCVVANEAVKISTIAVLLNGEEVTKAADIWYYDAVGNAYSIITHQVPFTKADVVLDTSKIDGFGIQEGKNVLEIVVTENNSMTSTFSRTFFVDLKNPEITSIDVTADKNVKNALISYLTFGIFANNNVKVTVEVSDPAISSGVKSVTLYNNTDSTSKTEIESKDNDQADAIPSMYSVNIKDDPTYAGQSDNFKADFIISLPKGETAEDYDLSAAVWDNVGHSGSRDLADFGDSATSHIRITDQAPVIKKLGVNDVDGYGAMPDGDDDGKAWYGKDVKYGFTVTDVYSGVHQIKVFLNGKSNDVSQYCYMGQGMNQRLPDTFTAGTDTQSYLEYNKSKGDVSDKNLHTVTVVLDTSDENVHKYLNLNGTGKNVVSVVAYSNNGKMSSAEDEIFYLDTFNPVVTDISFERNENYLSSTLNFLFFGAAGNAIANVFGGIYSDGSINVKVTAQDRDASSGIKDMMLYNDRTELKAVSELKETTTGNKESSTRTFERTYVLDVGKDAGESFYNNLNVYVEDYVGHTNNSDNSSVYDIIGMGSDKRTNTTDKDNKFEIAATKKAPDMSSITLRAGASDVRHVIIGSENWFSGNAEFELTAEDQVSKLSAMNVSLNGANVTGASVDSVNGTLKYTDGADRNFLDRYVRNADVIYNTKDDSSALIEGENTVVFTATANNGLTSESPATFYLDTQTPAITKFTLDGASTNSSGDPTEGMRFTHENPAPGVFVTDYGYYFMNTTDVTVTATDPRAENYNGSGLKEIHFYTVNQDGSVNPEFTPVSVSGETAEAVFTVNAGFKGEIYAYAVDMVDNGRSDLDNHKVYKPEDLIVESPEEHARFSHIKFERPNTTFKDIDGLDLYSEDVPVTIEVEDTYSGIKKIEYKVTSAYDTENNIDTSAVFSGDFKSLKNNSEWDINSNDKNIATNVSTTVTVKNNSNNIEVWVKLTDNAGNTTEETISFSIDKTAPTISVTYDNNDSSTRNGITFFNSNRTATIEITERNFNSKDVEILLENTFGFKPNVSSWTTIANTDNPDATIHKATITYTADGDYTFDVDYADLADNKAANYQPDKFTMDQTSPRIEVTFDNEAFLNGKYFKAGRTATITIYEHNFSAQDVVITGGYNVSAWTSAGPDVYVATIPFLNDGIYAFTVDYTDLARNKAQQVVINEFYIDKTAPVVEISNIINNSANKGNVEPVIDIDDSNYGTEEIVLQRIDIKNHSDNVDLPKVEVPEATHKKITYSNFNEKEEYDGIYFLTATATDKAGNVASASVLFSVNRFGSTFMPGNKETEEFISSGYSNSEMDLVVDEINVNKIVDQGISLTYNSETLKDLEQNTDYSIKEISESGYWHSYEYTVFAENFVQEGFYTLTFSSTDESKNAVTNRSTKGKSLISDSDTRSLPVSFVIDKTQPDVTIYGVEDGKQYQENSVLVKAVCEDLNLDPATLKVKLDNKELKENEDYSISEEESSQGKLVFELTLLGNLDRDKQSLDVTIDDFASNMGERKVNDFVLNATWLMIHWKQLLAGILALAAVIAGIVIAASKKRKNEVVEAI